jgi:thiamine pyrophosphokinase
MVDILTGKQQALLHGANLVIINCLLGVRIDLFLSNFAAALCLTDPKEEARRCDEEDRAVVSTIPSTLSKCLACGGVSGANLSMRLLFYPLMNDDVLCVVEPTNC